MTGRWWAGSAVETGGSRWAVLTLVVAARVATAIQIQSVGALGSALLADPALGMDYAGLGVLIGAYMLPGIAVALPAGWLTVRLGERRIVFAGLALAAVSGFAMAAVPGFGTALLARILGGAGAALLTVVLSAMVIGRFPGASLAPAMGGFLAAYPLGLSIALVALPALGGWRTSMLAVAVICALVLVAVPFVLPAGAVRSVQATRRNDGETGRLMRPGEWAPVVTAAIAWTVFNAAYTVLLGFTPAVLTARGASAGTAGVVASIAGWACVPLAPVGGALAERTGRPVSAVIISMVVAIVATTALAAGVGPQAGALLVTGLLISIVATVIMTLPARALSPETRATGMGVYYTVFYAGMAALPPVAGWAADTTGSAAAALGVAALFFVIATMAVATCGVLLNRRR